MSNLARPDPILGYLPIVVRNRRCPEAVRRSTADTKEVTMDKMKHKNRTGECFSRLLDVFIMVFSFFHQRIDLHPFSGFEPRDRKV